MGVAFSWRHVLAAAASGAVFYAFTALTFNAALSTFLGQTTGAWVSTADRALATEPGLLLATFLVPLVLSSLLQGGAWAQAPMRSAVVGAWPLLAFAGYMFVASYGNGAEIRNVQASFFSGVMLCAVALIAIGCGFVGGLFVRRRLVDRAAVPMYGIRWFHYLWLIPTAYFYLLTAFLIFFAAVDSVTYGLLGDHAAQSLGGSFVLIGGAIALFGVQRLLALHRDDVDRRGWKTFFFGPALAVVAWYVTYGAHHFRIAQFVGEHEVSSTWTLTVMLLAAILPLAAAAYLSREAPTAPTSSAATSAPLSPDYSGAGSPPPKPRARRPGRGTARKRPA